jgi:hypothetical protein
MDVTAFTITTLIAALIGGLLAFKLWRLGLSILGAFGGVSLALYLMATKAGGLVPDDTSRTIIIVVMAIAGSILIHIFEKPFLIGSTATSGSLVFFLGLDQFLNSGFSAAILLFTAGITSPDKLQNQLTGSYLGMLIGVVAFALLGIYYQYRSMGNHKHR